MKDTLGLLDKFAGDALMGMLANPQESGSAAQYATVAYNVAEAMLEERAKRIAKLMLEASE